MPKGQPGGCEIYRGNMPLTYLTQHGHPSGWMYLNKFLEPYVIEGPEKFLESLKRYADIYIFPRLYTKKQEDRDFFSWMLGNLRSFGKTIIYEVDDDLTNEHRQVIDGDAISMAKQADAITVSTPYLANLMTGRTGLKSYVLPNMIDPNIWKGTHVQKKSDQLIIGLTGSTTHYNDWHVLANVLPRILEENPNTSLLIGGFHPDFLQDLPRTDYIPPIPYEQYAQIIKACDIVLAPIDPTDAFNDSKSPIKVIEGMAAERFVGKKKMGAACIATNSHVYDLAIKDRYNGLLVDHTEEGWYSSITEVIQNEQFRHRLQRYGYNWVYQHHNIQTGWQKWAKAYQEIRKVQQ
jgi:glycosyltransferase involved in cell wall biosynthesis